MESRRCIKLLSPNRNQQDFYQCGCQTTAADLDEAKRLTVELGLPSGEATDDVLRQIIRLRVCKNGHRQKLEGAEGTEVLDSLVKRYKSSWVTTGGYNFILLEKNGQLFEKYRTTKHTVKNLLPRVVSNGRHSCGWIYIFSWPRAQGYLKIGYAVESPGYRTNTWQRCHSGAKLEYSVTVSYPQRMEELIHAELASRRHQLSKSCAHCRKQHSEWFMMTLEEARDVVGNWGTIAASPLYTTSRTLSPQWHRIVRGLSEVTALTLSQSLKQHRVEDSHQSSSLSKQQRPDSPSISDRPDRFTETPGTPSNIGVDELTLLLNKTYL